MDTNQSVTPTTAVGPSETQGRSDGRYGWLRSGRVLAAITVVALLAATLAFAGTAAAERWLPLLFVLPCALMMLMCMRHAGGHRQEPGASGAEPGTSRGDR